MESVLRSVLTGIRQNERDDDQVGSPSCHCRHDNTEPSAVRDASTTPMSVAASHKTHFIAKQSPEVITTQKDTVDGMGLVTFAHEDVSTFFGLFDPFQLPCYSSLVLHFKRTYFKLRIFETYQEGNSWIFIENPTKSARQTRVSEHQRCFSPVITTPTIRLEARLGLSLAITEEFL